MRMAMMIGPPSVLVGAMIRRTGEGLNPSTSSFFDKLILRQAQYEGFWDLFHAFGRLDSATKANGVGNGRKLNGIHARTLDFEMAVTPDPAPETLMHFHALNVGKRDLVGVQGEKAGLLHESMRCDPDFGRPFADHQP